MRRLYDKLIEEHLINDTQMAFIAGPRQVGKTTVAKASESLVRVFRYLNWDNVVHRQEMLDNPNGIFEDLGVQKSKKEKPIIVFDEIHKYKLWKNFIKGLYDTYRERAHIIVTGSAKLNIYKKSGDSLMGRYFLYRMHPLSIGEILSPEVPQDYFLRDPQKVTPAIMQRLLNYGGYPDPYLKNDQRYHRRWQLLKREQFFKEDVRELSQVQDLSLIEVLYQLLQEQAGQMLSYTALAKKIQVSSPTIKNWISLFEELYYCYTLTPWHTNITRSLIKEPKLFIYDWSQIHEKGARIENFVASHLLKAVHFWTDMGTGEYALHFLRNKEGQEVDFLITKDRSPWILIEVKASEGKSLSPSLKYFQDQTKAPYALQLAYDMPYEDIDFRSIKTPSIFPMSTFLSQLP